MPMTGLKLVVYIFPQRDWSKFSTENFSAPRKKRPGSAVRGRGSAALRTSFFLRKGGDNIF
jgi:hypothetical protein